MSIEEIQEILEPQRGRLGRVVWPVWERYLDLPEGERLAFDVTTEAGILHCYMVEAARSEFAGVPGVQLLEEYGFHIGLEGFPFGIDGSLIVRLKKLSEDGHSQNVRTRRAIAIRKNDTAELKGLPEDATIIDVGYVFNDLRTIFRDVMAIRVKDTQFVMSIPRSDDISLTMPQPLTPDVPGPRRFGIVSQPKKKSEPEP